MGPRDTRNLRCHSNINVSTIGPRVLQTGTVTRYVTSRQRCVALASDAGESETRDASSLKHNNRERLPQLGGQGKQRLETKEFSSDP